MSDTAPRNPAGAPQLLADALLRSVSGTSAQLRITGTNPDTNMSELGLVSTAFVEVTVSPVVMRKQRPTWQEGNPSKWELLVSATSVEQQVLALDLASAQSLFGMTVAVIVAGLLPIMFGGGTGSEVMRRIAAPMVGGMITAPLLSMILLPVAYLLLHRRRLAQKA